VAPARRLVDDPRRAVHEAQVLAEIRAEIRQAVEWDPVPETAATPAPEQALAHHSGDRTIRRLIVGELDAVRPHSSEHLKTSRPATLDVRRDSRLRSGVDEHPAGHEDSMNLA
jgi:hypothetical protein